MHISTLWYWNFSCVMHWTTSTVSLDQAPRWTSQEVVQMFAYNRYLKIVKLEYLISTTFAKRASTYLDWRYHIVFDVCIIFLYSPPLLIRCNINHSIDGNFLAQAKEFQGNLLGVFCCYENPPFSILFCEKNQSESIYIYIFYRVCL